MTAEYSTNFSNEQVLEIPLLCLFLFKQYTQALNYLNGTKRA
jgi:hypothetical protein